MTRKIKPTLRNCYEKDMQIAEASETTIGQLHSPFGCFSRWAVPARARMVRLVRLAVWRWFLLGRLPGQRKHRLLAVQWRRLCPLIKVLRCFDPGDVVENG